MVTRNRRLAEAMTALRIPVTAVRRFDGGWTFRIQKRLTNANAGNRMPHWSVRHRERQRWQALLATAVVDHIGYAEAIAILGERSGFPGAHGCCLERRRVEVIRQVGRRSHFIRDEFDNLRWSTKELRDALVQLELIHDDDPRWCDMSITQQVSPDGLPWTLIEIKPAGDPA